MKKIIFLFALMATLGCQQVQSQKSKKVNTDNLNQLVEKELIRIRRGCNDIVVIDLNKIPPGNREQWLIDNNYGCIRELKAAAQHCIYNETCSDDTKVIDLQLIKDKINSEDEDANNLARADWLNKNGDNICYKATYPHFMENHEITSVALRDEMVKVPHYDIKLADLKTDIDNKANTKFKTQGVKYFDDDKYNIYAKITVEEGVIVVKVVEKFTGESCYSIPFLRSIQTLFCSGTTPDPTVVLELYPFVYKGDYFVGFKVHKDTANGGGVYFLNYSTDPK